MAGEIDRSPSASIVATITYGFVSVQCGCMGMAAFMVTSSINKVFQWHYTLRRTQGKTGPGGNASSSVGVAVSLLHRLHQGSPCPKRIVGCWQIVHLVG